MRELLTATRSSAQIEVNGDVDESNVSSIVADGATIPQAAARSLRAAANGVVARGPVALPYCN